MTILKNYIKCFWLILALVSCFNIHSKSKGKNEQFEYREECLSAREYITTLEFLKAHDEFAIRNKNAQKLADQVSMNCTGASKRFVLITNILTKAKLDSATALKVAQQFASKDDVATQSFIQIFKYSYLKKYLDLSVRASMKLGLKLSLDLSGNVEKTTKDFKNFARFCVDYSKLDLPKAKCAVMAVRVASSGNQFKGSVTDKFISLYNYLRKDMSPSISSFRALSISEKVVTSGPLAVENFIQAYEYAISEKGLKLGVTEAIHFAKKMAQRSVRPLSSSKKVGVLN